MVLSGKRVAEIANTHPEHFVKYHRGLRELQMVTTAARDTPPVVCVFVGESGLGKSRRARDWLQEVTGVRPWVWNPSMTYWFDGYEGDDGALFEEFR